MDSLNKVAQKFGMKISVKKTKVKICTDVQNL